MRHVFGLMLVAAIAAGCDDRQIEMPSARANDAASDDSGSLDAAVDAAIDAPEVDAKADAGSDSSAPEAGCVTVFGSAMTAAYGRIDGTLRAVVAPTDLACPHDDNHVILQVQAQGAVYALWVDIESALDAGNPAVSFAEIDAPLGNSPFSEGWHASSNTLDYATTLGVSSTAFTQMTKAQLSTKIKALTKIGDPVSVYTEGFGPGGGHKVHRNSAAKDGAIVIRPTGSAHFLLFRFDNQSF